MARFGLFASVGARALQQYEGDYMQQEGEYVKIMKYGDEKNITGRQVAAIRLDKGQSVRELASSNV